MHQWRRGGRQAPSVRSLVSVYSTIFDRSLFLILESIALTISFPIEFDYSAVDVIEEQVSL